MRRTPIASVAAAAAAGLLILGASPASAADIPAGDGLYAFSFSTFFGLAADGSATAIAGLPDDGGKYGADYDSTTGVGYFFEDGEPCRLYTIDPTTGASAFVGTVGGVTDFNECDALNVAADGTLRIADQDGIVLTVDKATGAVLSSVVSDIPSISFISQAPDGTFYAGSYDGGLYTLDVATGAGTLVDGTVGYFETGVIDTAGTLWFISDGDDCGVGLWSLSLSDPTDVTFQGDVASTDGCESTYAILATGGYVPPAPQLAATGSAPATLVAPIAALVLLAGVGALAVSRRRAA
ncbi:hypothetical protein ACWKWO_13955 [Schumannella luteola]